MDLCRPARPEISYEENHSSKLASDLHTTHYGSMLSISHITPTHGGREGKGEERKKEEIGGLQNKKAYNLTRHHRST